MQLLVVLCLWLVVMFLVSCRCFHTSAARSAGESGTAGGSDHVHSLRRIRLHGLLRHHNGAGAASESDHGSSRGSGSDRGRAGSENGGRASAIGSDCASSGCCVVWAAVSASGCDCGFGCGNEGCGCDGAAEGSASASGVDCANVCDGEEI
jgi:hypothetical protein